MEIRKGRRRAKPQDTKVLRRKRKERCAHGGDNEPMAKHHTQARACGSAWKRVRAQERKKTVREEVKHAAVEENKKKKEIETVRKQQQRAAIAEEIRRRRRRKLRG
jgi:hypothetical protein